MVRLRRSFVRIFYSFSFFHCFRSLQVISGWLKVGDEFCGILALGRPLWVVSERKIRRSPEFLALPTTPICFFGSVTFSLHQNLSRLNFQGFQTLYICGVKDEYSVSLVSLLNGLVFVEKYYMNLFCLLSII